MISISVVIPCYNSSSTIEKCLDSVMKQLVLPLEIIVVDDGSIDDTVHLIKTYLNTKLVDSSVNVLLLLQSNSGPSKARNLGVIKAKGDWIAFLDSDDYWVEDKLQKQITLIENNPSIKIVGSSSNNLDNQQFSFVGFNDVLKKNMFQTSSVMVSTEVIKSNLFNEKQKYSEDYRCWLEILYNNLGAVVHPCLAFPIFKTVNYTGGGLSSRLWSMEKGEISNYLYLKKRNMITNGQFLMYVTLSYMKYLIRVIQFSVGNER